MKFSDAVEELKQMAEAEDFHDLPFNEISSILHKYKPKTVKNLNEMGFQTRKLSSGLFRNVYKVMNAEFVVKIPKEHGSEGYDANLRHCQDEYEKWKLIKRDKKLKLLHRYLPDIFYYNRMSGMICMPYYQKLKETEALIVSSMIVNMLGDLNLGDGDIHDDNVRYENDYGDNKAYKIIDLGYFDC